MEYKTLFFSYIGSLETRMSDSQIEKRKSKCRVVRSRTKETISWRRCNPGGGYSQKNWVGVCGPLPKSLTLFITKIFDIPYPIYELPKIGNPIYDLNIASKSCFRPALQLIFSSLVKRNVKLP